MTRWALGGFTNVIQSVWQQVQGKILTTSQDLESALRVATRLLRVVGLREQGPAQVAQATDERVRAYTLLLSAYDDVRRALAYLRAPQGDADDIAPALHPGRPRSKKTTAEAPPAPSVGSHPSPPRPPLRPRTLLPRPCPPRRRRARRWPPMVRS